MGTSGPSNPVSPTIALYPPLADHTCDDLRSAKFTLWLRPELCSFMLYKRRPVIRAILLATATVNSMQCFERAFVRATNLLERQACRSVCTRWLGIPAADRTITILSTSASMSSGHIVEVNPDPARGAAFASHGETDDARKARESSVYLIRTKHGTDDDEELPTEQHAEAGGDI